MGTTRGVIKGDTDRRLDYGLREAKYKALYRFWGLMTGLGLEVGYCPHSVTCRYYLQYEL